MRALDFLHNKGIESATCYTNKDTYYLNDLGSLIEEYARLQIEKDRERVINEVVKWQEHDCDSCACSCRGDLVINSNDDIRSLPINLD